MNPKSSFSVIRDTILSALKPVVSVFFDRQIKAPTRSCVAEILVCPEYSTRMFWKSLVEHSHKRWVVLKSAKRQEAIDGESHFKHKGSLIRFLRRAKEKAKKFIADIQGCLLTSKLIGCAQLLTELPDVEQSQTKNYGQSTAGKSGFIPNVFI